MHEIFQVYVDVIPDTDQLDAFEDVFGFRPPSEPLLKPVFEQDRGQPLSEHVSWQVPSDVQIVPPELLAAMKIRSLPDRDKSHKRVKDIADLHSLLWYVKDYREMKSEATAHTSETDLERLKEAVDQNVFQNAAQLLQIESELITDSIQQLYQ
jgi:hypothetical protein